MPPSYYKCYPYKYARAERYSREPFNISKFETLSFFLEKKLEDFFVLLDDFDIRRIKQAGNKFAIWY